MKYLLSVVVLFIFSSVVVHAQTSNTQKDSTANEIIYDIVDQPAEFANGGPALNFYLEQKLIYPPLAKANKVEGKVFVNFVVDKKGVIKSIKIEKGLGSGCDEEAIRLVLQMPKWKPARKNGELVNSRVILPVVFKIKQ